MKRRKFLQKSSSAGVGMLTSALVLPSAAKNNDIILWNKDGIVKDDFHLNEASIRSLQRKIENGEYTCRQIVQLYLDRIKTIDQNGPRLNAVIEVNPDALAIADQRDKEWEEGKVRGPLHGIPILIKDNIDTHDKMLTTAGSIAMAGNIASEDAFVVKKLREAGAVLLGKANLAEWANFRSTRTSSGWSSRGGQTRNPYFLDRNPNGSSSGSGASVSANLCAVAVGTETNGSIVCPASSNCVVGIKPTIGLISRSGIIPISKSQDTAGPMTRSVEDAAILLIVMAGPDQNDEITLSAPKNTTDYTKALDLNGLKGARIGIGRNYMGKHEEIDKVLEQNFEIMRGLGAELIDINEIIPQSSEFNQQALTMLLYEFKDGINKYLRKATPTTGVKSLEDIIAFNIKNAERAMPYFKQERLEQAQKMGPLSDPKYIEAVKLVQSVSRESIRNIKTQYKLDAFITPTSGLPWCTDLINGDYYYGGYSAGPAAWSGFPSISVPAGFVQGLPFGLLFFSTEYQETTLLKLAYSFEQATKHRRIPAFIQSSLH